VTTSGNGLPGWAVMAVAQDSSRRWSDITTTDDQGFFAVPNCPSQDMRVLFTDPEAETPFPDLVVEDVWPDTTPAPFVVPEDEIARGSLRVAVVDAWGGPVSEARVRIWNPAAHGGTWVPLDDDEGTFFLDDLPPGTYRVEIGSSRHGWQELDGVWIPAGGAADLGLVPFPEPGRLAFELEASGNVALDDLTVEIWREHDDVRNRVRALEGLTPPALLLPAGDYVATAHTRHGAATVPFSIDSAGTAALALGLSGEELALRPTELDPTRFEALQAQAGQPASCAACHGGPGGR